MESPQARRIRKKFYSGMNGHYRSFYGFRIEADLETGEVSIDNELIGTVNKIVFCPITKYFKLSHFEIVNDLLRGLKLVIEVGEGMILEVRHYTLSQVLALWDVHRLAKNNEIVAKLLRRGKAVRQAGTGKIIINRGNGKIIEFV